MSYAERNIVDGKEVKAMSGEEKLGTLVWNGQLCPLLKSVLSSRYAVRS